MKTNILIGFFAFIFLTSIFLAGCSSQHSSDNSQAKGQASFDSLVKKIHAYKETFGSYDDWIKVDYEEVNELSDSAREQITKFIKETVSAASLHMTDGDYEHPEKLVETVSAEAHQIYGKTVRKIGLRYAVSDGDHYAHRFVQYQDLDPDEREMFELLKRKNNN
jgi:hypothetical protein